MTMVTSSSPSARASWKPSDEKMKPGVLPVKASSGSLARLKL
jgi:hypothetical protein